LSSKRWVAQLRSIFRKGGTVYCESRKRRKKVGKKKGKEPQEASRKEKCPKKESSFGRKEKLEYDGEKPDGEKNAEGIKREGGIQ